jgi:hypothetical protein
MTWAGLGNGGLLGPGGAQNDRMERKLFFVLGEGSAIR